MGEYVELTVVDVDHDVVRVSEPVGTADTFSITVEPVVADPDRSTSFRIVGGEPRVWWVTGIDDVTTDVDAHGVVVRIPLVAGTIEFSAGSY